MQVLHTESALTDPRCEIRIKEAAWNRKYGSDDIALKYAWPDSIGRVARGGELPVRAIPQSIEALVREGFVEASDVLEAVARGLRGRP